MVVGDASTHISPPVGLKIEAAKNLSLPSTHAPLGKMELEFQVQKTAALELRSFRTFQIPSTQPEPLKLKSKVDVIADGRNNCCLNQLLCGLVHFIMTMAYEISSFTFLLVLTLALASLTPTPEFESFNLTHPLKKIVVCLIINVFLVTCFQIPTEKMFPDTRLGAAYLKTFGRAPLGALLICAASVFILGTCGALLIFVYELKLCNELLFSTLYGDQNEVPYVGVSIFYNPVLLTLYVAMSFPLVTFIKTFQWLKTWKSLDIFSDFLAFVLKTFLPCAAIDIDVRNYFFALAFELAEFVLIILIPSYVVTSWHQSISSVSAAPAEVMSASAEDSSSFSCVAYLYYIVACTVVGCCTSMLTSVETKVGIWTELMKEVTARFMATFSIFIVSFIYLLDMYFRPNTEKNDSICLKNLHLSIYATSAVKYILLSSFCFYAAFKSLVILTTEIEVRANEKRKRIGTKNLQSRAGGGASNFKPKIKPIGIEEKKRDHGVVHKV